MLTSHVSLCPMPASSSCLARNYCVALITLAGDALTKWAQEQGIRRNLPHFCTESLLRCQSIIPHDK